MSARGPADPPPAQHLFPGDLLAEFLERGEYREQRARLAALTAVQVEEVAASGWHCGFPRCSDPARYLSSLRYVTGGGQRAFLCDRHAASFATRHGIDIAAVLPAEGNSW